MIKKVVVLILLFIFGNKAVAEAYFCKVTENGFQKAAATSEMSAESIAWWMPAEFSIDSKKAEFWKDVIHDVSGGDRVSTFQVRSREKLHGSVYNTVYYININSFSNQGTLRMKIIGYEALGPVKYQCEPKGIRKNNNVSNGESKNYLRAEVYSKFNELSACNKKYLQQFLKGQGLYFGGIDGLYGRGTEKAVEAALKLPIFKNESVEGFFKKIIRNPVCN